MAESSPIQVTISIHRYAPVWSSRRDGPFDRSSERDRAIHMHIHISVLIHGEMHTHRESERIGNTKTKQECKNELKRMYYSLKLCYTEAHHLLWNINKSTIECHGNVVNCCGRACNDGRELKINDERSRACSRDRHVDCKIRSSVRRRTHPNL